MVAYFAKSIKEVNIKCAQSALVPSNAVPCSHKMSYAGHEDYHFPFPGESNMLIDISRRESVISLLLLVVVLCGYQIQLYISF